MTANITKIILVIRNPCRVSILKSMIARMIHVAVITLATIKYILSFFIYDKIENKSEFTWSIILHTFNRVFKNFVHSLVVRADRYLLHRSFLLDNNRSKLCWRVTSSINISSFCVFVIDNKKEIKKVDFISH